MRVNLAYWSLAKMFLPCRGLSADLFQLLSLEGEESSPGVETPSASDSGTFMNTQGSAVIFEIWPSKWVVIIFLYCRALQLESLNTRELLQLIWSVSPFREKSHMCYPLFSHSPQRSATVSVCVCARALMYTCVDECVYMLS